MENDNELIQVQLLVPRDRIADVYEMCSQLLRGEPQSSPRTHVVEFLPEESARPQTPTTSKLMGPLLPSWGRRHRLPGVQGWNEGEEVERIADALLVYDNLSQGAKKIVDVLVERPDEEISGDNLASQLGITAEQLTGTLGSLATRSKRVHRDVPFRYTSGSNGGTYCIESNIASLFSWARTPTDDILEAARRFEDARMDLEKRDGTEREESSATDNVVRDIGLNVSRLSLLVTGQKLQEAFNESRNQLAHEESPRDGEIKEGELEEVPMTEST